MGVVMTSTQAAGAASTIYMIVMLVIMFALMYFLMIRPQKKFGNNKNCRIPMKKAAIAEVEKASDATA